VNIRTTLVGRGYAFATHPDGERIFK